MNKKFGSKAFDVFNIIIFVIIGFVTLFPFWNIAVISLNEPLDAMKGGLLFWPRHFTIDSYVYIFTSNKELIHAFFISVLRTLIGTVFNVVCTTMLAYALSRRDFIARKLFRKMFVVSMYFSGGLIPFFILMKQLHFINNFWVYIIPPFSAPGLVSAFYLIIMISFIQDIPQSLQEAAKIDGANRYQCIQCITLPALKPTIITLLLLSLSNILRGDFEMFYQLIANNPALLPSTDIVDTLVFRSLTKSADFGMTSAAGFYQSVLCLVFISTVNGIVRKVSPDNALF